MIHKDFKLKKYNLNIKVTDLSIYLIYQLDQFHSIRV